MNLKSSFLPLDLYLPSFSVLKEDFCHTKNKKKLALVKKDCWKIRIEIIHSFFVICYRFKQDSPNKMGCKTLKVFLWRYSKKEVYFVTKEKVTLHKAKSFWRPANIWKGLPFWRYNFRFIDLNVVRPFRYRFSGVHDICSLKIIVQTPFHIELILTSAKHSMFSFMYSQKNWLILLSDPHLLKQKNYKSS